MTFDKDKLIVKQQLQIEKLKRQKKEWKAAKKQVHFLIYGIGAPLNGNKRGYTRKQMEPFFQISEELELL